MHIERIADTFMEITKNLYIYGSSASEIESYLYKIGISYNYDIQIACMGTVIYFTIIDEEGNSTTRIKRITEIKIDFSNLKIWETLSEEIISNPPSFAVLRIKLEEAKSITENKNYSFIKLIFAVFIASYSFCIVFGGNFYDALFSAFSGFLSYIITYKINNKISKDFFAGFTCHSFVNFFGLLTSLNSFSTLAGSIMVFVPGLLLTQGVLDLGERNFVTGTSKLVEATFVLGALIMGAGMSEAFWGYLI